MGDAIEALALSYMPDKNHIYSNSWGPMRPGSGHENEKPGPLAWKAIETVFILIHFSHALIFVGY